jgi:V8-like Glu-specific endopeptidase
MKRQDGMRDLAPTGRPHKPGPIFFDKKGRNVRIRQPFMNDSNGGGQLEDVPGFNKAPARMVGLPGATVPHCSIHRPQAPANEGFEKFFNTGDPLTRIDDASVLPFRSIAHLDLQYEDGTTGFGTGWFASASTIVTAGHCLYDADGKVAVKTVIATPGFTAFSQPIQPYTAHACYVPPEWEQSVNSGTPDSYFDYGLVYLSEPVGMNVSWFGLAAVPDSGLDHLQLNIAGYSSHAGPVSLYYDGGRLLSFDGNYLCHRHTYMGWDDEKSCAPYQ